MPDQALASEECVLADTLGPVDDLIGDDKVARSNVLAQRSDGGEGYDGLAAYRLESGDVGACGNFSG